MSIKSGGTVVTMQEYIYVRNVEVVNLLNRDQGDYPRTLTVELVEELLGILEGHHCQF